MEHTNSNGHPQPATDNDSRTRLLTVDETAEQLALGRSMVYLLMNSGELQSIRFGRVRRIPQSAVLDLIERKLRDESSDSGPPSDVQRDCDSIGDSSLWSLPSSRRRPSSKRGDTP